jgi:hypothetical protein
LNFWNFWTAPQPVVCLTKLRASQGTQARLLVIEGGRQDASRLCIKDTAGDIGWVSIKTKDGRPLLDKDLVPAYNGMQVRLQGNRHRISGPSARGAFSS